MRGRTGKVIRLEKKLNMQLKLTNLTEEYLMKIIHELYPIYIVFI